VSVRRASDGQPVDGVFLPMDPELWDPRRTRVTMLLDPGRIKRGLAPHAEAGYPLREGESVVVSVDAGWKDAAGVPLRASAERRYEVGPPQRARIDPSAWRLEAPPAGSAGPLVVGFDRALDGALLEHCLRVTGVPGEAAIGPEERSWSFIPDEPWSPGEQTLEIDTRLEDLAGNSVAHVFDRDLSRPEDDPRAGGTVRLGFELR
jgi:hypothetical protein